VNFKSDCLRGGEEEKDENEEQPNALWKNRLFDFQHTKQGEKLDFELFINLPEEIMHKIRHEKINHVLEIKCSNAFINMAAQFIVELRKNRKIGHTSKLSPNLLSGDVKFVFLDYLKEQGCSGLHSFLYNFVGPLHKKK